MNRVSAGIFKSGSTQQNPERQREDRAELHERAEVIARREQQPHRQHAGRQAVNDDGPGQRDVPQAEDLGPVPGFHRPACPPHTASNSSTTPMAEASSTLPTRQNRR